MHHKESKLEYEAACDRLCDDVATVLLALERPAFAATSLAATATFDLADALHHAAGKPNDARWDAALSSLARFVDVSSRSRRASHTEAFASLHAFLGENVSEPRASKAAPCRPSRRLRSSDYFLRGKIASNTISPKAESLR